MEIAGLLIALVLVAVAAGAYRNEQRRGRASMRRLRSLERIAGELTAETDPVAVLRSIAEKAELDPEFGEKFLRFIIDEVIRHHDRAREG